MKLIRRKLHDVELALKPLTFEEMLEVSELINATEDRKAFMKGAIQVLKISLKECKGLKDIEGEEIKLQFDGEVLSDECINDIVNCQISGHLAGLAASFGKGAASIDFIEGVEKLGKKKSPKKK